MFRRLLPLVVIIGNASATAGCTGSAVKSCSVGNDGGGTDLGTGAEAGACHSDDLYFFGMPAHMSADRTVSIRSIEIARGWLARGEYGEMVGRLFAEDGTVLDEYRDMDPMLCSGTNCPPYPHAIDFHLHIHMLAGTAFYELTDTISGKPPIRLDLRGHVQLLCMNAPCELDVCKPLSLDAGKPDLSDLDGGTSARDADVER